MVTEAISRDLRNLVRLELDRRGIPFEDRGHPFGIGCGQTYGQDLVSAGITFSEGQVLIDVLSPTAFLNAQIPELQMEKFGFFLESISYPIMPGHYWIHNLVSLPASRIEIEFSEDANVKEVAVTIVEQVEKLMNHFSSEIQNIQGAMKTLISQETQGE